MASMLARAGKSIVRSFALVGGVYVVSEGASIYQKNSTLKKEKGDGRVLHLDFSLLPAPPPPTHRRELATAAVHL